MKILLTAACAALLWAFIWGVAVEPANLTVRQETLRIQGWPAPFNGLKVAALSDLHVGAPHIDIPKLQEAVRLTNELKPDLIVLLGDYVIQDVVGGKFVEPARIATALKELKAPLGVYAILGNHDWWYGGDVVRRELERVGIPVLENASVSIRRRGRLLTLAGVSDSWTQTPDISKALHGIPNDRAIVVLTHNPDVFPEIPERVLLTLAGHTHGGQVLLPWVGRPIVPSKFGQRYAYDHRQEGRKHLFVTSGIGTSIIPIRFRVPPEIAILTLESENPRQREGPR